MLKLNSESLLQGSPKRCGLHRPPSLTHTRSRTPLPLCSYNDHREEGEAHEDTLHLDEQHGARQSFQDGGVEAWDQSGDVGSWGRQRPRGVWLQRGLKQN